VTAAAAPPVTAADDVREVVCAAAAGGARLRIAGRGTWLDAGHPVLADHVLSVAGLAGIVDYVPGDFTLTARAGTPLDEIARVAAAERQWLALDPFGAPDGTLGATVATGSPGPLAHTFGPPRDNVLGLEAVTGTGAVVRAGGRVVKNVAGFDLVRLFTGSWGTLGVLTEVTVRVRALPAVDETYALVVPDERPAALAAMLRELRDAPLAPYTMELVNGRLAVAIGVGERAAVLVRLAGNADAVRAQREALGRIAAVHAAPPAVWDSLRACEPAGATVIRFGRRPSELAGLWAEISEITSGASDALIHATASRGVVRCILRSRNDDVLDGLLADINFQSNSKIGERIPDHSFWPSPLGAIYAARGAPANFGTMPGDAALAAETRRHQLMRRVKDTFDPMHILNPGILGAVLA
jgi:glycolate oxidase FAD binding subunit